MSTGTNETLNLDGNPGNTESNQLNEGANVVGNEGGGVETGGNGSGDEDASETRGGGGSEGGSEDGSGGGGGYAGGGGGGSGGGGGGGYSHGDDDSSDEVDINEFPDRLKFALALMKRDEMLKKLLMQLSKALLVNDFIILMEVISSGKLDARNLPLLCCLERAKFSKLKSTTLMRFYPETKAFYRVAYRTWHGKGLLLMSGSKNQGQVRDHLTKRGIYDPKLASVNFVVPDVKTLFKNDEHLKEIPPTAKIQQSFDFINRDKEHVLTYDGKKLTRGYKGKKYGDEDMWGFERKPTLADNLIRLENDMSLATELKEHHEAKELDLLSFKAELMLTSVSNRLKEVRELEWLHRKDLSKYEKEPHYSEYTKSYKRSQIFACQTFTDKALTTIGAICEIKAEMNSMIQYFTGKCPTDLTTQENYDILFEPRVIGQYCEDLVENSELVKQGTKAWMSLRKIARVTGSSASTAIGLGKRKDAQAHYDEFILRKERPEPSQQLQEMFDHGHREEVCDAFDLNPSILYNAFDLRQNKHYIKALQVSILLINPYYNFIADSWNCNFGMYNHA